MTTKKRGGTREGAGRPTEYHEPTTNICFRCPQSKKEEIKALIKAKLQEYKNP